MNNTKQNPQARPTPELERWDAAPTAGHATHGQSAVSDANGKTIALVYNGKAHAQLIAAAPELLQALQYQIKNTEYLAKMVNNYAAKLNLGSKINVEDWTDKAHVAIAKATKP